MPEAPKPAESLDTLQTAVVAARQREMAVEHLLFKTIEFVEGRHGGLLEYLEGSLDHLGDPAHDATKNDDAVRGIARKMIRGARYETGADSR